MIVYEGPGAIDGAPIVVILTGYGRASANSKTGAMVQSWILRADVDPAQALATGADASICGACPHRPILARATGDAPCYVNVGRAPRGIWHAYRAGRYPRARTADDVRAILAGRQLRIGAYGDPAAAPVELWQALVALASGHTGYTHQWQAIGFDAAAWAPLVMASADSPAEAQQAEALGMRYFRVSIGVDKAPREVTCPASAEAGHRVQCADCMLCGGTSKPARSIVIADHAAGAARRVIMMHAA
jgi:hypothetical protein